MHHDRETDKRFEGNAVNVAKLYGWILPTRARRKLPVTEGGDQNAVPETNQRFHGKAERVQRKAEGFGPLQKVPETARSGVVGRV